MLYRSWPRVWIRLARARVSRARLARAGVTHFGQGDDRGRLDAGAGVQSRQPEGPGGETVQLPARPPERGPDVDADGEPGVQPGQPETVLGAAGDMEVPGCPVIVGVRV